MKGESTASNPQSLTVLLARWRNGDAVARDELMSVIYGELRRIAGNYLRNERRDHTLQPTALVNEVYLRLLASEPISWQNRAHFLAGAARLMRHMPIDHARSRLAQKRGAGHILVSLSEIGSREHEEEILALEDALTGLAQLDPRAAQVVEARFFGGLKEVEVAEALGISLSTVKRDWQFARVWLCAQLDAS